VWAYTEALERDMKALAVETKNEIDQLRQANGLIQKANADLAKHISAAQARDRDHRRKVIELAAAYALPVCIRHVNDTVIGTVAAVDAAFGLWDELDNRFAREVAERQGPI
jgi:hypothetical protein